jgi:uncharacterized integral membrane protein (TIGR00697 family)
MLLEFLLWFLITALGIVVFAYFSAKEKTSAYLISAYASLVLLSNILAVKLLDLTWFIVPAGIITYSLTFLITDILGEKYGKKTANKAIKAGLMINLLFIPIAFLAKIFPFPSFNEELAKSLANVLSLSPRIVIASIIAYLISQHLDVFLFHKIKEITHNKLLWLRNNLSTIISQFVDSVLFITIAFLGVFPKEAIIKMIFSQYLIKIFIALLDTPFIYFAVHIFNKFEKRK